MTNLKLLLVAVLLVAVSLTFGSYIHGKFIGFAGGILEVYYGVSDRVKSAVNEHFNQAETIKALREENAELKKSAMLLSTFAGELNKILIDKNSSVYEPKVQLVKALSYANLNDYNKFFVNFENFNPNKIYGLISEGKTAGILVNKDGRPLAILQRDEKSNFSVFIGDAQIPGVAGGENNEDGIFFAGVPVGKVKEIQNGKLYKSAVVEPYVSSEMPAFLYVVTKEN